LSWMDREAYLAGGLFKAVGASGLILRTNEVVRAAT